MDVFMSVMFDPLTMGMGGVLVIGSLLIYLSIFLRGQRPTAQQKFCLLFMIGLGLLYFAFVGYCTFKNGGVMPSYTTVKDIFNATDFEAVYKENYG